jgi:hypothetical protein
MFLPVFSTTTYASNSNEEWETGYSVGKYFRSVYPDQISKIHYRVINGTVEKFNVVHEIGGIIYGNFIFQVDINDNAILEIKVPRNHPYATIDHVDITDPIILASENGSSDYVELEYDVDLTDCFFLISVPLNSSSKIEVIWTYPSGLSKINVPDYCIPETVVEDVPVRSDGTISPLHQFRAGVAAEDIVCNEGFGLIIRTDGKPYCVTPATAEILNELWNK